MRLYPLRNEILLLNLILSATVLTSITRPMGFEPLAKLYALTCEPTTKL